MRNNAQPKIKFLFKRTIERLTAYFYWFAQTNTSSYDTVPNIPSFFNADNLFTVIFLVIGIVFLCFGIKKEDSNFH